MNFNDAILMVETACIELEYSTRKIDMVLEYADTLYANDYYSEEAEEKHSSGIGAALVRIKEALVKFLTKIKDLIAEKIFHKDSQAKLQSIANGSADGKTVEMIDLDAIARENDSAVGKVKNMIRSAKSGGKSSGEAGKVKDELKAKNSKLKTAVKVVAVTAAATTLLKFGQRLKNKNNSDLKEANASLVEYKRKSIVDKANLSDVGYETYKKANMRIRDIEEKRAHADTRTSRTRGTIERTREKMNSGKISKEVGESLISELEASLNGIEQEAYSVETAEYLKLYNRIVSSYESKHDDTQVP